MISIPAQDDASVCFGETISLERATENVPRDGSAKRPGGGLHPEQFCRSIGYVLHEETQQVLKDVTI